MPGGAPAFLIIFNIDVISYSLNSQPYDTHGKSVVCNGVL